MCNTTDYKTKLVREFIHDCTHEGRTTSTTYISVQPVLGVICGITEINPLNGLFV